MNATNHVQKLRSQPPLGWRRQRGALTIFTGIFVLVLMTLMLVYATRVGIFEQRVSSNEMRQKLAFHAAETAMQNATEYLLANKALVSSSDPESGPDGLNTDPPGFRAGWFFDDVATRRWRPCQDADLANDHHPCGGDVGAATGSFYYDTDNDNSTREFFPLDTGAFAATTTARATAVLCLLDFDNFGTMGCATDLPDPDDGAGIVLITLMGYGYSDCIDADVSGVIENDEIPSCTGEAVVSIPVTSLAAVSGGAGVPLVTKNALPTSGTAEIVANPNAGGIGVPATVWANGNDANCPPKDEDGIVSTALAHKATSWATCERHEWFGVDYWPDPLTCPSPSCKCDTGELISGPLPSGPMLVDKDITVDPLFPCDLFEYYFNVPRTQYELVKANAEVYSDCSSLNQSSSGLIWISGPSCTINSNTIVGTEKNPVMLVIATGTTLVNGGAVIYGTVFFTEVEVSGATVEALGGQTVYGQMIVDALFPKLLGTFQVVYADGIVARAAGSAGLGVLNHGWRDWGHPDITW